MDKEELEFKMMIERLYAIQVWVRDWCDGFHAKDSGRPLVAEHPSSPMLAATALAKLHRDRANQIEAAIKTPKKTKAGFGHA